MHQNCPVCQENLFNSTSECRVLRCGHTMHRHCLRALVRDPPPSLQRAGPSCAKTDCGSGPKKNWLGAGEPVSSCSLSAVCGFDHRVSGGLGAIGLENSAEPHARGVSQQAGVGFVQRLPRHELDCIPCVGSQVHSLRQLQHAQDLVCDLRSLATTAVPQGMHLRPAVATTRARSSVRSKAGSVRYVLCTWSGGVFRV